eukprot:6478396-Amphidinium_carterae.1
MGSTGTLGVESGEAPYSWGRNQGLGPSLNKATCISTHSASDISIVGDGWSGMEEDCEGRIVGGGDLGTALVTAGAVVAGTEAMVAVGSGSSGFSTSSL